MQENIIEQFGCLNKGISRVLSCDSIKYKYLLVKKKKQGLNDLEI